MKISLQVLLNASVLGQQCLPSKMQCSDPLLSIMRKTGEPEETKLLCQTYTSARCCWNEDEQGCFITDTTHDWLMSTLTQTPERKTFVIDYNTSESDARSLGLKRSFDPIKMTLAKELSKEIKEIQENYKSKAKAFLTEPEQKAQDYLNQQLTKFFTPKPDPPAPRAFAAAESKTELHDFDMPGDTDGIAIDYSLIDWEVLERCFNQMETLKVTHNCFEKNKKQVFDQQSCLANGCLFQDEKCFYCDGAYQNMLQNKRSKKWINSNTDDICVITDSDKLPCDGYEEKPIDTLVLKRMKIMNPLGNQLISHIRLKKNQQQCLDLGCCYDEDPATKKKNFISKGGPVYAMMAENLIPEKDSLRCYAKAEQTLMMKDTRCMPDRATAQCGQPNLLPIHTTPQQIDSVLSDEGAAQPWMATITLNDEIKCSGVVICKTWILTSQSCVRKYFDENDNLPMIVLDRNSLTDLSNSDTKIEVSEIVHHPLYKKTKYSSRKSIGHDLTLLKLKREIDNHPICLPTATDANIGDDEIIYTVGMGAGETRFSPLFTAKSKIDKFSTQPMPNCYMAHRSVDFVGALCLRALNDEYYMDGIDEKYTTRVDAVSQGDRGGIGARYHKDKQAWILDGIIAGAPLSRVPSDGPTVLVDIRDNLSWIEDVTNGCCAMVDFGL